MRRYLSRRFLLRFLLLAFCGLLWAIAAGNEPAAPLWAGEENRAAPQATQPAGPPLYGSSLVGPETVWSAWAALTPGEQAKVDGRILDELRGLVTPTHLGGADTGSPRSSSPQETAPRLRTRFLVYLEQSAALNALDERVFASQADRRAALVEELRATAQSSQTAVLRILAQHSAERMGDAAGVAGYQPFFIVNAVAVDGDLATVTELARQSEVVRIVANYPLFPIMQTPRAGDDASQDEESGADRDGRKYEWNLRKVQADRVHAELNNRGAGAVVGGFDTGVILRHPALLRQYRGNENGVLNHNYNWFVPDGELYANGNLGASVSQAPTDCDGYTHGTHTMGTMVGDAGGSASVIGMAPEARWIAVPGICGSTMPGGARDDIGGIKAFQWFLCPTDLTGLLATADCSKAPDVVNNSWGSANPVNDTFRPIIQVLRAAGVAPVFAAGNPSAGPGSISTPANAPEAISVGATDDFDWLTYFSAQGPSVYPGQQKPEFTAPGSYVISSVGSNRYVGYSGTSMAAPHVAGLIALLVSADLQDGERDFDVEDMERLMALSALDLGEPGADPLYGYGRIDAYAALQLAASAGDLRGQILDKEYGAPLSHARIEAYHPLLDGRFTGMADASGFYSLTAPAGEVQVTLSRWGYEPATIPNQLVVAGALSYANFSLLSRPQAQITGVVRDEAGPVANALIYASGNPALQTRSDRAGRYQLQLPLGDAELVVEAPRHRLLRQPIRTPGLGAQIDLLLRQSPSILLVDSSALGGWFIGWPVYRFFTRALEEENYLYDLWRIQYSTFSDTKPGVDGSTLVGLPSAETLKKYDLVIWVQSFCSDAYCRAGSLKEMGAEGAILNYLDGGGRLFLSGQDIGPSNQGSELFDSYLQAEFVAGYAGFKDQQLTPTDFLSGLDLRLTNGALYGYANGIFDFSPDGVAPRPDGISFPVLRYGETEVAAALAVAPCAASYRALYLAAGFENLAPRADQSQPDWTQFLDLSIGWLTSNQQSVRFALSARDPSANGLAGGRVTHSLTVANLSTKAMRYRVDLSDTRWPVASFLNDAPTPATFTLPPCSRQKLQLVVDLPLTAQLGETDTVTATLASISHPNLTPAKVAFQTVQMPRWSEAEPLPNNRYQMGIATYGAGYHLMGGASYGYYNESGEWVPSGPTAIHQRFDACANRWEALSPLPAARTGSAVARIGKRIYAAGGEGLVDNVFGPTASLFIYDIATDRWSQGAPMPQARAYAASVAVGDQLYLFGGYNGLDFPDTILVYDPATDQWRVAGQAAYVPGSGAAAALLGGKIYLIGGYPDYGGFRVYDPATNEWQWLSSPSFIRTGTTLVTGPGGYLYLLGGESYGGANVVERYHVARDLWSIVNVGLEADRLFASAAYVEGRLYLVGGGNPIISHESLRIEPSFCESALVGDRTATTPSEELVYAVQLQPGVADNPSVHLTAPLGPGLAFAGFRENRIGAVYNTASHQVEWSGSLLSGQPARRLSYAVRLDGSTWQPGERITHTVNLSNGQNLSFSRSSSAQIFVPDFSASSKGVHQTAADAGVPVTYTIDLRSHTPVGGRVVVTDPLSSALLFVEGSLIGPGGSGGYDPTSHSIVWQGAASQSQPGFVNLGKRYVWGDSLETGSAPPPTFVWQDIRETGQLVVSGPYEMRCDLPVGFDFPLYGRDYRSVCVDVHGTITFDDPYPYASSLYSCPLIGDIYYPARIAGLWGSLAVDDGVYMQTFGQTPRPLYDSAMGRRPHLGLLG